MINLEEKTEDVQQRIDAITLQISELERDRICLMMLYRDLQMKYSKICLEEAFENQLSNREQKNDRF